MAKALHAPAYRDSTAPVFQDVIAEDPMPAPAVFQEYSEVNVPVSSVSRSEYTSPEFAQAEQERMWSRVWQMACREEQLREPGDIVVYESPGASIIVVRTEDGGIRGFYNSCLHRGMRLCAGDTSVRRLTCPFHGFTWNLDGSLAHVPARWDFPGMKDAEMHLPEVRVETWGGFVFINRDADAPPLETYLGRLVPHFADWSYGDLYLATTIRKTIQANWKTGVEAFLESYHLSGIHAQALPFGGDASTQYDVWEDDPHVSRFLEPTGIVSDQYPRDLSEQEILDFVMKIVFGGAGETPKLEPGMKARHFMSAGMRAQMGELHGRDYSAMSDSEAGDAIQYFLFPNIVIFRSLPYPFVYRFLPVRDNPNQSTFEFLVFKPRPTDGSEIPEVEVVELGPDDTFAGSGVLPPWQGEIYDQDVTGLAMCQLGIRDGGDADIIYSRYQEVRIRHLHDTLHRYLDGRL